MIISEVVTLGIYALSMVFLPEYFGVFVFSFQSPGLHFRSIFSSTHVVVCASLFQIYHSWSQCGLDGKSLLSLR